MIPSMRLDWPFFSICAFRVFLVGLMGTIHILPNSAKHKFLGKLESHTLFTLLKIILL